VVVGRRVRCPSCDELVEVSQHIVPSRASTGSPNAESSGERSVPNFSGDEEDGKGTVMLSSADLDEAGATVILEAIEVPPAPVLPVVPPAPLRPRDAGGTPPPRDTEEAEEEPKFRAKPRGDDTEMDMTPMVDVVFQLLIFFMLTAAFALQKSLTLPKPADEENPENVVMLSIENSPEHVIVRVDEFNTYHVIPRLARAIAARAGGRRQRHDSDQTCSRSAWRFAARTGRRGIGRGHCYRL
jgi:biopolymer transport protein ExbD